MPTRSLNYTSEDEYIEQNNLTKKDIVENSIKYILNEINENDLEYLTDQLLIFSNNCKIKIINEDKEAIAVYFEIIDSLAYIQKTKDIIKYYPKYDGDHLGTKHRQSNYKSLLKTQLKILKNRIDGRFFTIINEEEIKKTKMQIKFIEYSLKDKYKNFPSWFNFLEIY